MIINKSILDAFDAEFSKISIDKILIQGAKGECIGVKRGEYQINGAILNDCLDHSISVGEHASLEGNKIFANNNASGKYGNARYHKRVGLKGIMAKDPLELFFMNIRILVLENAYYLLEKDYYDGALIKVKKDKFSCEVTDGLSKDEYSFIEFF